MASWCSRDPTTRATLVEYLTHDRLAIRQCAHALLTSLAPEGQKIPYDPTGQPEHLRLVPRHVSTTRQDASPPGARLVRRLVRRLASG